MRQETLIEAVRQVKCPAGAWFKAYPSILNHVEIAVHFRNHDGDEGHFTQQVLYVETDEKQALEVCRSLWIMAAETMFDSRNRHFARATHAARPIFAELAQPEGVRVKIG